MTDGVAAPEVAVCEFRAMGSAARVIVVGGDADCLGFARARIDGFERRWSRFLPGSEVSRLNKHAGAPVVVSRETFDLVARACAAADATGGRYDPTVLGSVVAAGYDASFETLPHDRRRAEAWPGPSPGVAGIACDQGVGAVRLPSGSGFDPGGIGKGLAADLVVADLRGRGAAGAMVSLGGDLRVSGRSPSGGTWCIGVSCPREMGNEVAHIEVREGGVATSSTAKRRWKIGEREAHHLIDPATGMPARSDVESVTVIAGEAWWAEVLATAALVAGRHAGIALLDANGVAGVLVGADGSVYEVGRRAVFARSTAACA